MQETFNQKKNAALRIIISQLPVCFFQPCAGVDSKKGNFTKPFSAIVPGIFINFLFSVCAIVFVVGVFGETGIAQTQQRAGRQSIEQILIAAAEALDKSDLASAKDLLRRAVGIAPGNATAHTLTAIVADRENDLNTAVKHFAQAARLAPGLAETRNNYGAILLRLNRKAEASREFAASLKINPNQQSALVNLAQIRFVENNLIAAQELFEKAKAIRPDAEILRALVVIALKLKNTNRAKQLFAQYFELMRNSAHQAARAELGAALLESNLADEAIQELEAALLVDKEDIDSNVLLSRAYLKRKDIKAAGRLLEALAAKGFDDARIYAALAEIYESGGYFENAIPAMRLATRKQPENELYRVRYGLLLIDSKAPAAAIIRLNEALKEFPNSARLWFVLGIAYFQDEKNIEAQKAFEKALTIDPKLVPALAYLATAYVERAEYSEAAKIYRKAIGLDNQLPILHYLLADTLLRIADADPKQTEAALKRAVELDSRFSSAYLTLGTLYVRQGRWAEALEALERAAELEPENAEALYQLGRVYARLKRADESKAVLAKFKQLSEAQKEQREVDRRELVRRLADVRF